jgi:hypothetical protein
LRKTKKSGGPLLQNQKVAVKAKFSLKDAIKVKDEAEQNDSDYCYARVVHVPAG